MQVPVRKIALGGFKDKRGGKTAKKWAWAAFTSSARKDGLQLRHWVRADAEFTDYPFARFNKRSDVIKYTDYEYAELTEANRKGMNPATFAATQEAWPKDHSDHLFDLARRFDMRWPLVIDRWEKKPVHQPEELKRRFFHVTARILKSRRQQEQKSQPSAMETFEYRYEADRLRRKQLESSFVRLNENISEERRLLKELAAAETAIRKTERKLLAGGFRSATMGGLGGDAPTGEMGWFPEMFAGSDAMAARNLASKTHGPSLLPEPGAVGAGAGAGAAAASAAAASSARNRSGPSGARTQQMSLGALLVVVPERDPFSGVTLRSSQMTAPPDGQPADSRSLIKAIHAATMLQVPDRPMPTANTLLLLNQLRRELMDALTAGKEVKALEEQVYKLEKMRKDSAWTGYGAPLKPAVDAKQMLKATSEAAARVAQQQQQARPAAGGAATPATIAAREAQVAAARAAAARARPGVVPGSGEAATPRPTAVHPAVAMAARAPAPAPAASPFPAASVAVTPVGLPSAAIAPRAPAASSVQPAVQPMQAVPQAHPQAFAAAPAAAAPLGIPPHAFMPQPFPIGMGVNPMMMAMMSGFPNGFLPGGGFPMVGPIAGPLGGMPISIPMPPVAAPMPAASPVPQAMPSSAAAGVGAAAGVVASPPPVAQAAAPPASPPEAPWGMDAEPAGRQTRKRKLEGGEGGATRKR